MGGMFDLMFIFYSDFAFYVSCMCSIWVFLFAFKRILWIFVIAYS